MTTTHCSLAALALACASEPSLAPDKDTPRELGAVRWQRELEPALAAAGQSGRPAIVLFQEVPG